MFDKKIVCKWTFLSGGTQLPHLLPDDAGSHDHNIDIDGKNWYTKYYDNIDIGVITKCCYWLNEWCTNNNNIGIGVIKQQQRQIHSDGNDLYTNNDNDNIDIHQGIGTPIMTIWWPDIFPDDAGLGGNYNSDIDGVDG